MFLLYSFNQQIILIYFSKKKVTLYFVFVEKKDQLTKKKGLLLKNSQFNKKFKPINLYNSSREMILSFIKEKPILSESY